MSLPNAAKVLGNLRDAFAGNPALAHHGENAPHQDAPAPTDPTDEHTPHMPENAVHQELRLALVPLYDHVEHMTAQGMIMARIMENIKHIYDAPLYRVALISPTNHPYVVEDVNRNHVACFVATAQAIQLQIPGIGAGINYDLTPGWNQLDFPPLTMISTSAGAGFNALFLYSMDRVANA